MLRNSMKAKGRRTARAVTLVELMVVLGIVGTVAAVSVVGLGQVQGKARKAACMAQMRLYGRAVAQFVAEYGEYPHMGTIPYAWPKFYGVMQALGVPAPDTVTGPQGREWSDYSPWELDEVWPQAFCPAMDAAGIIGAADEALADGLNPAFKPAVHRAAAGYQWNVTLRAAGFPVGPFPSGRWPPAPWQPNVGGWDNTLWIDMFLQLPDGKYYIAQAVHPNEIDSPARVAEAWDSWDHESIPELDWTDWRFAGQWRWEDTIPGWHVGPQSGHCKGWALLNGYRHRGSPNILYADGHVACDATRRIPTGELDPLPAGATWEGAEVRSWNRFDAVFGTMDHIVPQRRFTTDVTAAATTVGVELHRR